MKKYTIVLSVIAILIIAGCEKENQSKFRVLHGKALTTPVGEEVSFRENNTGFETTKVQRNGYNVQKGDDLIVEEEHNRLFKGRKVYRVKGIE